MRLRTHLLVYLFYLAVTFVITYPLITVLGTRMIGHPFGDAYEYTHHIWWIKTALQMGQNPFFMPNLVYPDGVSATLLWSLPLQSFPAWLFAFVLPLPAAFNLAALLTLALNGWAMFFLAKHMITVGAQRAAPLQTTVPALLAGLVFMLYPAFQGQLGAAHTGLLTLWPAPIYLCCLFRLRDTRRVRRTMIAGALLFAASLWGSVLLLIYLIAPITASYVLMICAAREWRALRRALVTMILGAILALPFVVPLAVETLRAPPEPGAVRYSAALLGIVSPSFYHPLFGDGVYNRFVLGVDPFEQASYVGIVAVGLVTLGVLKVREARLWLLMGLVAWVFSLGALLKVYDAPLVVNLVGYTTRIVLPWALFQNLPLMSMARTPARFSFAVGFAVAVTAGYGVRAILSSGKNVPERNVWSERLTPENRRSSERKVPDRRLSRSNAPIRTIGAVVLMIAVAFEYQFWWPLPTVAGVVPAPIAALAERDDLRAVLDIPWYHPLVNKDGMFLQTGHGLPMIVGQVARRTPADPAKVNLLQDTLDAALLDAAGVDIVILHKEYDGNESAFGTMTREKLGDPFYEDDQYAVFEVPPYRGEPPGFVSVTDGANLYFYAPEAGEAMLVGQVEANERPVQASLDGTPLVEWTARGTQALRVPLAFTAGYHAITISLTLSCPEIVNDPLLVCPPLTVTGMALEDRKLINGGS